jgi:macrolide-specific efflux system membrane fusion protein
MHTMSAPSNRLRSLARPLAAGVLALALAGGGAWAWQAWGNSASKTEQYVFATVQRGDIEDLVGATGALQPRDYVDVGAQVSGQLKKLHVDVGAEVKEGDLLAEIDATQSAARVDANRASLRAQQATLAERQVTLDKAERDLQRQRNLMAEEATTAEQLQNAETAVRTARAQIASLQAQIQQQQASMRVEEANLKFAKIYAPMAGTVISVTARQGQTLNANQSAPTLLRIADLSTMTVQTQVGEADVGKLRAGMPAYFTTLGSAGRRFNGTLAKVEPTPTVTNNVVLYNALFDVPNPGRTLLPQMTAQVFFVAAEARDALVVPVAALTMQRRAAPAASAAAPAGAASASPTAPATGANAAAAVPTAAVATTAATAAPSAPNAAAAAPTAQTATNAAPSAPTGAAGNAPAAATTATPDDRPAARAGRRARGVSATAASTPRRATVRVAAADGTLVEREVTVGVSNRINAQIVAGLAEGERIVVGEKAPDAPARAQQPRSASPLGGPTRIGSGGSGGGRR